MNLAFNWMIGGRATGKTYGSLKSMLENREKFIFMRRTAKELKAVKSPILTPIKKISNDLKIEIHTENIVGLDDCFCWVKDDECIATVVALSTFKNIRGFDTSDTNFFIYDEFIPEIHAHQMAGEYEAFENAYESINRNRELEGKKPVQFFGLSNSDTIMSPLLAGRGLIPIIEKMKKEKQYEYINKKTSTGIFLYDDSTISEQKKKTVQYQSASKKFVDMAINNEFSELQSRKDIKSCSIKEYRPVCTIGEISIFKNKNCENYYVTPACNFNFLDVFENSTSDITRYKMQYPEILCYFIDGKIIFCNSDVKYKFLAIYNMI